MGNVFKRVVKGILLRANTSDPTDNKEGSIWHNSTSNRIKSYIESAVRTLVSEDQTQTLTGKSMDGDDNTFSDIGITSLKTELADADKFIERDATGALVSGKTVPTGDVVGTSDTQILTAKTIDGTSATGTNTVTADMSNMTYDPSTSGLTATNGQAAIDEVEGRLDTVESNKLDGPGTHTDNLLIKTDGVNTNVSQTTGISISDTNDVTGVNDLTVDGNLTVNGTTTTVNTNNLNVTDKNITINDTGNDASSEGAGLTVERTGVDGSFVYEDALASKFKIGPVGSEVEIVDVSSTQVITNKDIDGGTASNTSRLAIPKDTTANLDLLTDKQALLAFDTTTSQVVANTGAGWEVVGESVTENVVSKNSSVTLLASEDVILTSSGSALTLTLSTAVGFNGKVVKIKKVTSDFNVITIDANAAETIDGSLTTTVNTLGETLVLISNGSNWEILDRHIPSVWANSTLVIGAVTTPPTTGATVTDNQARWRRVGTDLIYRYDYRQTSAGTAGSGEYLFPVPTGLTIDTGQFTTNFGLNILGVVGSCEVFTTTNSTLLGTVEVKDSTNLLMTVNHDTYPTRIVASGNNGLNETEVRYSFIATVPITGWKG